MVRTQIYLDDKQKSALERLSAKRRATISDLIRQAVDQYITRAAMDFDQALGVSFGIWRNRSDIGNASDCVRKSRREWTNRDKRS